ncbi:MULTISPECIES: sulfate transporter CysZ [Alteromonadaceae]|uniref:Sulfate transporter CysZ n=1 Tax=Brumicola blandensis TaxID=3075611 RepID=A0AAW8R040_9ALTE|nr:MULTISPECIES: sulfate transporter CysZ [unclassified Alteromonas]MDT0581759.1 sulfate transporter CysZ [Alteromonas sp. W409]MDT0629809.1 sulfate transporter CysZ [Alteromonas sp. W364]
MSNKSGASYFFDGFSLIGTKGLKRFVFVPLFINLLLFSTAFYFLIPQIQSGVEYIVNLIPEFLGWLKTMLTYILWPLALISVLLVFALIFGSLANWIAAPFNGLLSEKVERHLTGQSMGDEGLLSALKDVPRTLGREMSKMLYFIPRAIGFLILFFLIPVFGQILWFMFTAWMMAIQYCDYPFDNHKVGFQPMRNQLLQRKGQCFSFGIMVNIFSLVPILNFLVMPVAICGATSLYVDEFSGQRRTVR